jgi:serine/threonine protein phosphatase PrpC
MKSRFLINYINTNKQSTTKKREGVGTSKITLSKGQNIESILKDDHNVQRLERQKSEG